MLTKKVIQNFIYGRAGSSKSLTSTGKELYSYNLLIARNDGAVTLANYTNSGTFISQTTSKHVGYVRPYASKIVDPSEF